jgi:hypothetical protein
MSAKCLQIYIVVSALVLLSVPIAADNKDIFRLPPKRGLAAATLGEVCHWVCMDSKPVPSGTTVNFSRSVWAQRTECFGGRQCPRPKEESFITAKGCVPPAQAFTECR